MLNNRIDAGLTALFMVVVIAMLGFGLRAIVKAAAADGITTKEVGDGVPDLRSHAA